MMTDISIIIPVYNVEDYIAECLESVMSQTVGASMECLLIDDCGRDNSMALAESIVAGYDGPIRFRIIRRTANGGLSAARNTGIREAEGRYLYFLDSDDFIAPDCMEVLYEEAIRHKDVQIVVGDFQTLPQKDILRHISLADKDYPTYSSDRQWIRSIFMSGIPITSWNKLYQRQWIIDNNLFFKEGILHEDDHWQALAYPYISSLAFVNKVTYFYRQRSGSIIHHPDAGVRKVKNLAMIYDEMYARSIKWDYPWRLWALKSLMELKKECEKYGFNNIPDKLISRILKNSSVPFIVKLYCLYYKYSPIGYGKRRLMLWAVRIAVK